MVQGPGKNVIGRAKHDLGKTCFGTCKNGPGTWKMLLGRAKMVLHMGPGNMVPGCASMVLRPEKRSQDLENGPRTWKNGPGM